MEILVDLTHAARHMAHLTHDLAVFGESGIVMSVITRELNKSGHEQVEYIKNVMIGHDHPGWPPLAGSTVERKAREGFSGGPLERTGTLRESYSFHVLQESIFESFLMVGSTSDEAIYHEIGTIHHPPRPVLTPTAHHFEDKVAHIMGGEVEAALVKTLNRAMLIGSIL